MREWTVATGFRGLLALALLGAGIICLLLVLFSEKGRLFGPPDAEMGPSATPAE